MIHLTIATPLGIDSLFFSFVERLAVLNGHRCVNPPAEKLNDANPGNWIKELALSHQHHFVIGFRYPPSYWLELVKHSSTVIVLADGDGIARQVEGICKEEPGKEDSKKFEQCIQEISSGLNNMVGVIEWLLCEVSPSNLLAPAAAFQIDPYGSFQRLERFYVKAAVPFKTTSWQDFSTEALPLLSEIKPASIEFKRAIQTRLLTMQDDVKPLRLNALSELFKLE